MDYKKTAENILSLVGGVGNVVNVVHCATRLRFTLNDEAKVDTKRLQNLETVKGIVSRNGQLQLIIGEGAVNKVYAELERMQTGSNAKPIAPKKGKQNPIDTVLEAISSIFASIIPAIVGAGLLWGISYSLTALGVVDSSSSIYTLLNTFGNSAFYFLPIYISFSAAKRFGCNAFVAATVGGILIHPTFTGMVSSGDSILNILGLGITLQDYSSTIIPAILIVLLLSYVEKGLKKVIPNSVDLILTPTISLIVCGFLGLWIIAPLGNTIGSFIAEGFVWVYNTTGILGGAVYGFFHSILVVTGMQVAFTPITVQNLATYGYDLIYPIAACANAAMGSVCFYAWLKAKSKKTKSVAGPACLSALVGVTEPAVFGVALRFKKLFLAACIGGAAGGVVMSIFKVVYMGFGLVPFGTIILAFGDTFVYYLLGVAVSMVVSFLAAHILGFSDEDDSMLETDNEITADTYEQEALMAPVEGKVIPISTVSDKTFSGEVLGRSIAITPQSNLIKSPVYGTVENLFDTGHAIGLKSANGVDILIHIGIDTISLKGKYFTPLVGNGDQVEPGTELIKFDLKAIRQEGYDPTVIMVITNADSFSELNMIDAALVKTGDTVLTILG